MHPVVALKAYHLATVFENTGYNDRLKFVLGSYIERERLMSQNCMEIGLKLLLFFFFAFVPRYYRVRLCQILCDAIVK